MSPLGDITKTLVLSFKLLIKLKKLSIALWSKALSIISSNTNRLVLDEFFNLAIALHVNKRAKFILDFSPSLKLL